MRRAVFISLFTLSAGALASGRAESHWKGLPEASSRAGDAVGVLEVPSPQRILIPKGTFTMGSTAVDMLRAQTMCEREMMRARCDESGPMFRAEGVAHAVTVSSFYIDRTEVTVGAYERCVAVGKCSPADLSPSDSRFAKADLPVVQITWEDANGYCRFKGGRLPTEAEWEFAARGPEGREFPWGNVYNPHLANHGALAHEPTDESDGFRELAPVGSFRDGATKLGVHDLAGNAAEWVADFFSIDEKGYGYSADAVIDPKGPASGSFHVVRGGSFTDGAAWLRGRAREAITSRRSYSVGFRCAYSLR